MSQSFFLVILSFIILHSDLATKYTARTGHLHIESSSKYLDVIADNYQVFCELSTSDGHITIRGLTKSFEFKMGALDRAFNSERVNLGEYGKFTFSGRITNFDKINFTQSGTYPVAVKGILEMGKYSRKTNATGTLSVNDDGTIRTQADFEMTIEEESVETINQLMKEKLPSVISLDADKLGISRSVRLSLNATLRPRR